MKKQILIFSALLAMTAATTQAQTIYVPTPGTGTSTTSNVGIGTNAPEEKLTVTGGNIKINGTTNGLLLGNAIKIFEEGNVLKFKTSATDIPRFYIYPSGHIGIGANDWGNALNMYGNIAMGADGNGILFMGNSNVSAYSNGIAITTNGVKRMNFTSTGNIEVNSDILSKGRIALGPLNGFSPTHRLSVLGGITTDFLTVLLPVNGIFPDYVFGKDYKLMSLSQVEKFIHQEQHLPEVPSAKEIEKNGINTSEMFMIQMKKIEELTLYMIELEKKNAQLEEKVARLSKE